MENPAHGLSSVPVWVWLGVVVVVFIALTQHTASQSPTAPADTGASAATNDLQKTQLAAQTAVALRILDITGAEDIARIQARTQEQTNDAALSAIQAQASGGGPQTAVNVTVNKNPNGTTASANSVQRSAVAQSFARLSALATRNVRMARTSVLNNVSAGLGNGTDFGHGL